jgi:hypothetical protein
MLIWGLYGFMIEYVNIFLMNKILRKLPIFTEEVELCCFHVDHGT